MRAYTDHVLALLPFEPAAHARLGGPQCTYVGHPLIERQAWLQALDPAPLQRRLGIADGVPVLVVLPGSRSSEVRHLMDDFGQTIAQLHAAGVFPAVILPIVETVRERVEAALERWPVKPHIISGDEDKFSAFKLANAALAASGTVTLELALACTPMVVAYRVDKAATIVRYLIKAQSIVLANLVLGENAIPEYIQEKCTPAALAAAIAPLLRSSAERDAQLAALATIPSHMLLSAGTPSANAAAIVLDYAKHGRHRLP
jgi:lipid-A-disaccharide synthase